MNKLEYTILHNLMDKSWRVYKYIERWYGWRHIYLKYMHLRGENTQLHNAFLVKCAICYCILDAAKFQSGCKHSVRNRLSELARVWRRQNAKKKYEWKVITHNPSQFRFIFSPIFLSICKINHQDCQQRMLQMNSNETYRSERIQVPPIQPQCRPQQKNWSWCGWSTSTTSKSSV